MNYSTIWARSVAAALVAVVVLAVARQCVDAAEARTEIKPYVRAIVDVADHSGWRLQPVIVFEDPERRTTCYVADRAIHCVPWAGR